MGFIYRVANILIMIGIASLLAGVGIKIFYPEGISWVNLAPGGFLRFANTCLLVGIALFLRDITCNKMKKA